LLDARQAAQPGAPTEVLRVIGLLNVFEVYQDCNVVLASFEPPGERTKIGLAGGPDRAA